MKKSLVVATFLGVAGASASAYALSSISFKGSDTLFTLTQELLTPTAQNGNTPLCPGAVGLTYLGGGSGTGEGALVTGAQTVAPMSRFLQGSTTGLCAAAGTTAEGIVFALDGVGVFTATATGGSAACNGAAGTNSTCTPTTPAVGLAYDTTVADPAGAYTFLNYKDVLKVLYAGVAHAGAPAADQGCNGSIRQFLANNYGSVFEVANCTGSCTQIRHIFRRDDSSGTSDIFSQLLGLASPNNITNQLGPYFLGVDSFCNAFHAASGTSGNTAGASVQSQLPVVAGATVSYQNVIPYDYQDNDPIRRACAGTGVNPQRTSNANENVCEPDGALPTKAAGTLGLVLPMADTSLAGAAQFGSGLACSGGSILAAFPTVPTYNSAGRLTLATATCPNGDSPSGINCNVPTDANGNPNCVADQNTLPPISVVLPPNGLKPANADGRVFNKFVYNVPASGTPTVATDNTANGSTAGGQRPIMGAYYRLHQTLTMNNPDNTNLCAFPDMTQQIGCLVQASPCSIGYAGRVADNVTGTTALLVSAIPDSQTCVQQFSYPLSRKLYLDSLIGFGASGVNGQELALAKCEGISSAAINQAVTDNNFVPLPSTGPNAINGGAPFAEDFNEAAQCAAASNNVAFTANAGGLPTVGTVCGNGTKEAFEDCDNGTANVNGGAPGTCSLTCRLN